MTHEDPFVGKDFHTVRREDHEDTIAELSQFPVENPNITTREAVVDAADIAYGALHRSAGIVGPFEWPSARAGRLQREAMQENRPPVISSFTEQTGVLDDDGFHDPNATKDAIDAEKVLEDFPSGTVAIKETINDNDPLQGSFTVNWLHCESACAAESYLEQVGTSFEEPGPGEDDGRYTFREIIIKQ